MSAHDSSNQFVVSFGARRRQRDFHDLKGYRDKPTPHEEHQAIETAARKRVAARKKNQKLAEIESTRLIYVLAEIIVDLYVFQKFHGKGYLASPLHREHSEDIFTAIGIAISEDAKGMKHRFLKLYTMDGMMHVLKLGRIYDINPELAAKLTNFYEDFWILAHDKYFDYDTWRTITMRDVFEARPRIFTNAKHATI